MRNLLVDEMRNKCRTAEADAFVVSFEGLAELNDEPVDQEFADLR